MAIGELWLDFFAGVGSDEQMLDRRPSWRRVVALRIDESERREVDGDQGGD